MAGEGSIQVVCKCGKKLKAPATSVGKKARCPACGTVMILSAANTITRTPAASAPPKVPPPAASPADDDGMGALYDLADQANSAAPPPITSRCPKCQTALDDGAVLCTNCGYDTRTGQAVATAPPAVPSKQVVGYATPKKDKKPIDYMAPQGSIIAGMAMSAAFALAASVVWVAVAWLTGLSIGYIAILIGVAAGLGMRIGQKGFSTAGGYASSGITLAAILLAKFVVLELVIADKNPNVSIFNLNSAKLAYYFFSPIGLIIIAVGLGAAFRTANGSVKG